MAKEGRHSARAHYRRGKQGNPEAQKEEPIMG